MYFSGYDYYDENLNFKSHGPIFKKGPSFRNALVDCISLGISTVINSKARDIMLVTGQENTCGHDWWAYITCISLGNVIYDKNSTLKYRRTGNNVSPGGNNFFKMLTFRIKKFLINDYFKDVRDQLQQVKKCYYSELSDDQKKLINIFTQRSILNYFKKLFYPKMFRQTLTDEMFLRMVFLIGKI